MTLRDAHGETGSPSALPAQVMAFPGSLAKPMNPENLNGVDDNTQLMHLHEPSLLFNLCPTHRLLSSGPSATSRGRGFHGC